ncbi:hypothetical protein B0T24DRAFT_530987 [Lasiosphaeria ovina]|uniref:RRM domain-containing protein n=1 Tax=Lasiosphaeria ovina TaxID=92902 RepID=A0AAE0N688_9PEZI|nr:hypothetical protein B0T24DRAFT_530987 [Lasiosphaeria ovina]
MAPELRKKKSKQAMAAVEEPAPVAAKKPLAKSKMEKRKAPEQEASPIPVKKQKPSKDVAPLPKPKAAAADDKPAAKKAKKSKGTSDKKEKKEKEVAAAEPEEEQQAPLDAENDGDEEMDDETQALVDALDGDDDSDSEEPASGDAFKTGQSVGKIPKSKKSAESKSKSGKPGVMYLGRLPHGFYEHELREYFSQFGAISKLRVVRNKKTGASRHRAFIEFDDAEVADIAARTMDKYLLFGHILAAKFVAPAQVHPNLFKGSNRRFKVIPWNKMAGKQLERALPESKWAAKVTKEEKRRAARAEKLKAIGYEFESPKLKAAEAKEVAAVKASEPAKPAEAAPAAEAEAESKAVVEKVEAPAVTEPEAAAEVTSIQKKKKKGTKAKKVKA